MFTSTPHEGRLRLFVFLILLASYLFAYIPTPDSADGDAILALSAALLRQGDADISILGAQDALFEHDMSRMGAFGTDGALYSKKGIAPSLALLPLTAAAQFAPWLPLRATAMLFNPLVTALTGTMLFMVTRRIGFSARTAVASALLYGWATTAAVYSKTLFGEPLAALLIITAVLGVVRFWAEQRLRWLLVASAASAFAIGINLTYILTAGLLGLGVLLPSVLQAKGNRNRWSTFLRVGICFVLPILIALAGIALYNLARFSSPLTSGYYLGSGEGFNRPLLTGLFGLTISPYRGLLWYAPVVILALPGAWLLFRQKIPRLSVNGISLHESAASPRFKAQHSRFTLLISALIVAQFVIYATWWSWHGGVVWGPRFVVPVLPLIMLCAVPVVDRSFSSTVVGALVAAVAALSIGVQFLGVLLSPYPFYGVLSGQYGTGDMSAIVATLRDQVLYDVTANAALGNLQLLTGGAPLDPAWLRGDGQIALAGLVLMATAVWLLLEERSSAPVIALVICAAALNVVAVSQNDASDVVAVHRLEATLSEDATALLASNHYGSALMDIESRRILSIAAPTDPDDPLASPIWQHAQTLGSRLWYVTWFPPADTRNWVERALWQSDALVTEAQVDGHRALLFEESSASGTIEGGWSFGDLQLVRYGLTEEVDTLQLVLEWQSTVEILDQLSWFVHLLDAEGAILAQQDRQPLGGYLPTTAWAPGEPVIDRLSLPIADSAVAIRIGWVNPMEGTPLMVRAPDGAFLPDRFIVIPVVR